MLPVRDEIAWAPALLVAGVITGTMLAGLADLAGGVGHDGVSYHLLGPREWVRHGLIRPLLDVSHTAFPQTVETLFGLLLMSGAARGPGMFAGPSLLVLCLAAAGLGRRIGLGARGMWWIAALVATMPAVHAGAAMTFIDAFYAAVAIALLTVGLDVRTRRTAVLFGVLAGGLMATKYTGLIAAPLIGLVTMPFWPAERRRDILLAIATGLAVAAPPYLRTWWLEGSPIYPPPTLLLEWFTPRHMPAEAVRAFNDYIADRGAGLGRAPADFLFLPYRLTVWTARFHGAGGIGPALLALAPFGVCAAWRGRPARLVVTVAVLLTLAWFLVGAQATGRARAGWLLASGAAAGVAFVDTGHTHYNELLNDGRVVYGDRPPASAAQLNYPAGLALNFRGLYIADSQNGVVRRVALSNGSSTAPIDTFAHITTPTGMAFDVYGALRVVDAAHGTLTQFLSTGAPTTVKLPADDLTVDLNGSLLVTHAANGLIRSIALDGSIGILAGGSDGSSVDGHSALEVTLKLPGSVAVDPSGNLYIADRGNHRVVKVNANGTAAHISELPSVADPASVRVDATGNLLVTDEAANRVYSITPTGVLRVIAGDGTPGDSGDNGPASAAQLKSPATAIADGKGNIYIADRGNGRIRQADSAGVIRNLLSGLAAPRGLALDGLGNLYFVENDAARVSRLDLSTGLMQAIGEGVWKTPLGISAAFADGKPTGDVYVADSGREQIFHVAPSGEIDAVAGSGAPGSSDDGSVATAALLGDPSDVAIEIGRAHV